MNIELTINGDRVAREIEPQVLLLDMLRDSLGLTGCKRSCDVQVCGACTVLVDGEPVSACCHLAADVDGRDVLTIEGLREQARFAPMADAFTRHAALQCGFCTPGMLLTVAALLDAGELSSEEEIRRALAGNLCRCTGYRGIIDAVASSRAGRRDHGRDDAAGRQPGRPVGAATGCRREAARRAQFVGDIVLPGMLHGHVLRRPSPTRGSCRSTSARPRRCAGWPACSRRRISPTWISTGGTRSATARSWRTARCASRASRWRPSRPTPRRTPPPPAGRSASSTSRCP